MKFKVQKDGEWVQPIRRGYLMKCCDCGLVHRLNFRLVKTGRGQKIQFQAFRVKSYAVSMRRSRSPGKVSRTSRTS